MADYVTLLGSEEVGTAGRNIRESGVNMMEAANRINESLRLHQQFMDDWLERYQQMLLTDAVSSGRA